MVAPFLLEKFMDSTIQHRLLTGDALHEPKGCATAASGTAYLANGEGSGSWKSVLVPDDQNYFAAINYGTATYPIVRTGYSVIPVPITLIRSRGSKINGSNLGTIVCDPGYYEIYFNSRISVSNDYPYTYRLNNVPNYGLINPVHFSNSTTVSLQAILDISWNTGPQTISFTNTTLIIKEI